MPSLLRETGADENDVIRAWSLKRSALYGKGGDDRLDIDRGSDGDDIASAEIAEDVDGNAVIQLFDGSDANGSEMEGRIVLESVSAEDVEDNDFWARLARDD